MKNRYLYSTALWVIVCSMLYGGNIKDFGSQLPELLFEKNRGQFLTSDGKPADDVLYKSKHKEMEIYLTKSGLSYVYRKFKYDSLLYNPAIKKAAAEEEYENFVKTKEEFTYRINLVLKNANKNLFIEESDKDLFYTNYYTAQRPEGILRVPHFKQIEYHDVWNNINWRIKNSSNNLKHEFVLRTGANLKQVRYKVEGAKKIEIKNSRLLIHTPYGTIEENDLYCYVEKEGVRQERQARYVIEEDGSIGFDVEWDGSETLVIDPNVFWSTYHISRGATGGDGGCQMTTDNAGNIFATGASYTLAAFPVLNPFGGSYFQGAIAGNADIFILKFSPGGVKQWATFYGGSMDDATWSVKPDNAGNILIAGYTSSVDFPTQNAYDPTFNGVSDAFVMSFSDNGIRNWATYLGGSGNDYGLSVTADLQGNVYTTGYTFSGDFPRITPSGAYTQAFGGGTKTDFFITKFTKSGSAVWSTYFGGNTYDMGTAITVDKFGNIYVTGSSDGNMPLVNPGGGAYFDNTFNGGANWRVADVVILKFSSTYALLWSTYYGGNGSAGIGGIDQGYSIVTDQCGNIFVLGNTESTNIPTVNPWGGAHFENTFNDGVPSSPVFQANDMFLLKFSNTGALVWATYYGGPEIDYNNLWDADNSLAIDKVGNIYITFGTYSQTIPIVDPTSAYSCPPVVISGQQLERTFVAVFNNNGVGVWATYIDLNTNKTDSEQPESIAVDATGNILSMTGSEITGGVTTNFLLVNPGGGAYVQPHTASLDREMYFIKFTPVLKIPLPIAAFNASPKKNCSPLTVNFTNTSSGYDTYTWNFGDGSTAGTYSSSHLYTTPGTYVVTLILEKTANCIKDTLRDTVRVLDCNSNGTPKKLSICAGACPILTASTAGTPPYSYSWNTGATTQTLTPCPSGSATYIVTITDALGSTHTDTTFITIFPALNVTMQAIYASCSGINNGGATAKVNNGSPPFTYTWSNGATSSSVNNLSPGTYTITATDANGCTGTQTVAITTYPTFTINISSTPSTCPQGTMGTGTATPLVTGGTGTYSYSWMPPVLPISNRNLNPNQTQLSSGVYTLNVIDGGTGCSQTATVTIAQGPAPTASFTISPGKVVCLGSTVTFTNTGTLTTGTWQLYGSSFSTNSSSTNFSYTFNTPPGTGMYTIRYQGSQGGCNISDADTIVVVNCTPGVPSPVTFGSGCANSGDCSKSISVITTGGTQPYSYSWNTGSTNDTIYPCATSDATYTVTVTDVNGTKSTTTASISISPPASFTQSPAGTVCLGATVNFTGISTSGATYSWNIGSPLNVSGTTANFSASFLYEGKYNVTHTVGKGVCSNTSTSTVNVINCAGPPTITASGGLVCAGNCSAVTSSATSGVSPYTYSWSTGETTQNINPCPTTTTTYTVKVTDAGGGTATSTAVVTVNPAVTVTATSTNITCRGTSTGSATATPAGGTPVFNYVWSNGITSSTGSNLAAGNYTVTIIDSKGCTSFSTTTITAPPALLGLYSKGSANCSKCGCKEWIMLNATGGTSPYSYSWPDGYDKRYKNALCPGVYNVIVTDNNGCKTTVKVNAP